MGKDVGSVILFGLINTFMVVPVSISFCAIIFRDEVFDEYMPSLVKLVLFSSAIHQLCFSLFSSLPFAIGQVQDAGLIFLSAMAGSVASSCSKPENVVPSTLFILALSTSVLGVMLIIVSKLKLASVVQYLPMPVIGGYLAFIGFFCGEAGLSMMAGVQVTSISQWDRFLNRDAIILLLPGLICGLGMSYCLHKFPSPLTFPVCLISILSVFYLSMILSGSSFEDMRNSGWISPLDKAGSSFDAWKLYDISKVEWNLFPKQIITLLGMFLVVAFSSSLDVAAIEMELGLPLDYNRELNTVGISNLVSGLLGGYTGSYIFTQTTFNMRRGINNRWCGFMVVIGEIVIAMLPVSVVSFIPKMFFGSLLVLIASELLMEWLIVARTKMMQYEYAVCLLTFMCIQMVGIELGMLIGVIAAMFCFVISYSNLQSVSAVTVKASTVIRTFEERSVLIANRGKVLTVSLSGYLFFGSAVKLLQEIKSKLVAADDDTDSSSPEEQELSIPGSHFTARKDSDKHSNTDMIELSPPPTLPKKLSRRALGSSAVQSSLDDVSSAVSSNDNKMNGQNSTSAFAGMTPLKSSSSTTAHPHEHGTSSTAASSVHHAEPTLGHSYQHEAHSHGSHLAPSSHHQPMRMLFSSSHGPRQQKHIPTVYDLSADQIQSHYEHWSHAQSQQKPPMERKSTMSNGERRPSSSDLEMGHLFTPDKAKPTATELPPVISHTTQTPTVNERTSLLTAAINNSYSKEESHPAPLVLSSSLTNKGLEDVKEIRESSVFLQVWESQQQRKEQQQRKRRSYSDMSAVASSLSNTESDFIDRLHSQGKTVNNLAGANSKASLGYNFHSQENLEDMDDNRAEISPLLLLHPPPVTGTNQEKPSALFSSSSSTKSPRKSLLSPSRNRQPHQQGQDTVSQTPLASANNNNNNNNGLLIDLENVPVQDMVTEYLILDFTTVIGVDATAARACFLTLVQFMRTANVTVVFAHLSPSVEELLRAHNVLHEDSIIIPNLDDALEWCEDQILIDNELKENTIVGESMASRIRSVEEYSRAWAERQQHSLANRLSRKETPASDFSLSRRNKQLSSNIDLLSLAEDFSSSGRSTSARALRHILIDYLGLDLSNPSNRFRQLLESSVLTKFFSREQVKTGEIIFDIDSPATKVFFIESGTVELVSLNVESSSEVVRVNKASHGGVFGEADFILGKLRTVRAYSVSDCTFWILDREHFAAMEVQQPQLCMLIQYALLRSLALSYTCSMYALHPTTAYADDGNDV